MRWILLLCLIGCSAAPTAVPVTKYRDINLVGTYVGSKSFGGLYCSTTEPSFNTWLRDLHTDRPYLVKPEIPCDQLVEEDGELSISCEEYDQGSFPWYYVYYDTYLNADTLSGKFLITIEIPETEHWCFLEFNVDGIATIAHRRVVK